MQVLYIEHIKMTIEQGIGYHIRIPLFSSENELKLKSNPHCIWWNHETQGGFNFSFFQREIIWWF